MKDETATINTKIENQILLNNYFKELLHIAILYLIANRFNKVVKKRFIDEDKYNQTIINLYLKL